MGNVFTSDYTGFKVIDVRAIGADSTGDIDAQPCLQAAIDEACLSDPAKTYSAHPSRIVFIPRGQYRLDKPLVVKKPAAYDTPTNGAATLTILGEWPVLFAGPGFSGNALLDLAKGAVRVTLQRLFLHGNNVAPSGLRAEGFNQRSRIEQVAVRGASGDGFSIHTSYHLMLQSCSASRCGRHGFFINRVQPGLLTSCASVDNFADGFHFRAGGGFATAVTLSEFVASRNLGYGVRFDADADVKPNPAAVGGLGLRNGILAGNVLDAVRLQGTSCAVEGLSIVGDYALSKAGELVRSYRQAGFLSATALSEAQAFGIAGSPWQDGALGKVYAGTSSVWTHLDEPPNTPCAIRIDSVGYAAAKGNLLQANRAHHSMDTTYARIEVDVGKAAYGGQQFIRANYLSREQTLPVWKDGISA